MKRSPASILIVLALVASSARAEVKQAAADGFLLEFSEPVAATPAEAYAAITALPAWWSNEHTWSGKAANLSLKSEAGGCFCERWLGGSVEHGRVVMAVPQRVLRLDAALGPLQELAVRGMLSFWINTNDDGSLRLDVEYRVNGASSSGLDQLAPDVDDMIGAQVARLKRFIDTGNAEPAAGPKDAAAGGDANAGILAQWAQQAAQEAAASKSADAPKSKPVKQKPSKPKDADGP